MTHEVNANEEAGIGTDVVSVDLVGDAAVYLKLWFLTCLAEKANLRNYSNL